jgi:hypothetical protein
LLTACACTPTRIVESYPVPAPYPVPVPLNLTAPTYGPELPRRDLYCDDLERLYAAERDARQACNADKASIRQLSDQTVERAGNAPRP